MFNPQDNIVVKKDLKLKKPWSALDGKPILDISSLAVNFLFEEQKGAGRPFFFQKVLLHFLWAEQLKLPSDVCWKMLSLKGETMEGSVLRLLYNQVIPCLQTLSHVCSQRPCAKNKMLFNFDSLRWWKTFESDQFKKMKLIQGIVFFLVNDNKYARGLISN